VARWICRPPLLGVGAGDEVLAGATGDVLQRDVPGDAILVAGAVGE
jgi:hypothetical protein